MNTDLIQNIKGKFQNNFKDIPLMVFSPGRINLIGEHTDYNNGFVFPAAIDKGIVVAINKSTETGSKIIASDLDEVLDLSLEHPKAIENGRWKNYVIGVVAEIQKKGKNINNFNMVFGGDIPRGAGLSSSAALENGIVFGLNELFNLGLTKKEMIFISQKAEHDYVGVKCGIMDQYASMFGQKDAALLLDCENLNAKAITINLKDYEILLINSNVKHSLAESAYNERRLVCEKVAAILNLKSLRAATEKDLLSLKGQITDSEYQKAIYVLQENQRVLDSFDALKENNIEQFGKLLYRSHSGMQQQYKISCDELDFLVDIAKNSDTVIGARMMGGGFGGCTINIMHKASISKFVTNIKKAYKANFGVECSIYNVTISEGTHLI